MLRKFSLFFLISCLASGCSSSDDNISAYQKLLDQALAKYEVPGIVMGVSTPEGTWLGAAGKADLADGTAMTPEMQVHVASLTKPFTATMVMRLVEDGAVKLSDTVEHWLPGGVVKNAASITVEMLLAHRSGIFDHEDDEYFFPQTYTNPSKEWTAPEVLAYSNAHEPSFPPGTGHKYCNTGFYLLGMIIEAATGETVESFAQRTIFAPAGMKRTALTRSGAKSAPYAHDYSLLQEGQPLSDITDNNLSWDWTAGALVTTAADVLAFSRSLADNTLLSAETFSKMIAPIDGNQDMALGVIFSPLDPLYGQRAVSHSGMNLGYVSQWVFYLDSQRAIFVAINRNDLGADPSDNAVVNAVESICVGVIDSWKW